MVQVTWEFVVKQEALGQFEQAYGPGGEWNRLFGGYPGGRQWIRRTGASASANGRTEGRARVQG